MRWLHRMFEEAGWSVRLEHFPVGRSAHRFGSLAAFGSAAVLIALGGCLRVYVPSLAALVLLAAALLIQSPWWVIRMVGERWRSSLWSRNVVAEAPEAVAGSNSPSPPSRLVILAHHDSKSQRLPTGLRVGFALASTLGCGLAAAAVWTGASDAARLLDAIVVGALGLALVGLCGLLGNRSGNASPGALDNASGLAVMLELAERWGMGTAPASEIVFVATGAEEVGLDGARAFLRTHEWWLIDRPTLVINLDSVGAGDHLKLCGTRRALELAEAAARAESVPTRRFRILGAGMDHQPFADRGFEALSVLGDVVRYSSYTHTKHDTISLIDPETLEWAVRLAERTARVWAEAREIDARSANATTELRGLA